MGRIIVLNEVLWHPVTHSDYPRLGFLVSSGNNALSVLKTMSSVVTW